MVRRSLTKELIKPREERETASLRRSLFLKKVLETAGTHLLQYIEITSSAEDRLLCTTVFAHIKQKANTTLSRQQQSLIKKYLASLGVGFYRTSKVNYFTKLKLKD